MSYPGSAVNNAMSMSALTTQERKIIEFDGLNTNT